jgi:RNA polymerase-binding transcription factor DksA
MRTEDLTLFRGRLVQMRARLTNTVNGIGEAISEDIVAPGTGSNAPTHAADAASGDLDENLALAENAAQLLGDVESALERIQDGSYGQCQRCERAIARERLMALPHTPYCIQCAQLAESELPADEPRWPSTED